MWKDDESQPTEVRIVRVLDNLHFNLGMLVGLFAKLQKETQALREANETLRTNNEHLLAYQQTIREWNAAEWGDSTPDEEDA